MEIRYTAHVDRYSVDEIPEAWRQAKRYGWFTGSPSYDWGHAGISNFQLLQLAIWDEMTNHPQARHVQAKLPIDERKKRFPNYCNRVVKEEGFSSMDEFHLWLTETGFDLSCREIGCESPIGNCDTMFTELRLFQDSLEEIYGRERITLAQLFRDVVKAERSSRITPRNGTLCNNVISGAFRLLDTTALCATVDDLSESEMRSAEDKLLRVWESWVIFTGKRGEFSIQKMPLVA